MHEVPHRVVVDLQAASGQFGKGSMEPKVEAVADFVAATPGSVGVIGAAEEIPAILAGTSGTRIVGDAPGPTDE